MRVGGLRDRSVRHCATSALAIFILAAKLLSARDFVSWSQMSPVPARAPGPAVTKICMAGWPISCDRARLASSVFSGALHGITSSALERKGLPGGLWISTMMMFSSWRKRKGYNVFGGGTSFCKTDSHGGVILRQQQSTGLSSNLGQFDIVHTIFSCNPCCRNKRKKHKVFLDAPGWALPPNIGNVEVRTLNIYSQIKWTYASPYTCPNSVHCHINKNDVCFWHQYNDILRWVFKRNQSIPLLIVKLRYWKNVQTLRPNI